MSELKKNSIIDQFDLLILQSYFYFDLLENKTSLHKTAFFQDTFKNIEENEVLKIANTRKKLFHFGKLTYDLFRSSHGKAKAFTLPAFSVSSPETQENERGKNEEQIKRGIEGSETNLLLNEQTDLKKNKPNETNELKNIYLISRQLGLNIMGGELYKQNLPIASIDQRIFPWLKNNNKITLRYFTIKESLNPTYKVNYIIENFEINWNYKVPGFGIQEQTDEGFNNIQPEKKIVKKQSLKEAAYNEPEFVNSSSNNTSLVIPQSQSVILKQRLSEHFPSHKNLFPLNHFTKQLLLGSILDDKANKQNMMKLIPSYYFSLNFLSYRKQNQPFFHKKKENYLIIRNPEIVQQLPFNLPPIKYSRKITSLLDTSINKWATWYSFLIKNNKTSLFVLNNYNGVISIPRWKNKNSFLKFSERHGLYLMRGETNLSFSKEFNVFGSLKKENRIMSHEHDANKLNFETSLPISKISQNYYSNQINPIENNIQNEYIQMDIWTDGSISPRQSLVNAFQKLFELFFDLSNNIPIKNNNVLAPEWERIFVKEKIDIDVKKKDKENTNTKRTDSLSTSSFNSSENENENENENEDENENDANLDFDA